MKGHFTIRQTPDSDIEPHHVQTLVLRSHSATEIEIGIHARTVFHAREVIFGFKGNRDSKPVVTGRARQFVKSGNLPDQTYYVDHADWCHAVIDRDFNRGTHIVMGFAVQTRQPGRYEVQLSFVTDEIEGNYERLAVLVETIRRRSCHATQRNTLAAAPSILQRFLNRIDLPHGNRVDLGPNRPEILLPSPPLGPRGGGKMVLHHG